MKFENIKVYNFENALRNSNISINDVLLVLKLCYTNFKYVSTG